MTITDVVLLWTYVAGTNEATSLYLRKNNTTDTTLSTTIDFSAGTTVQRFSGLNIPLAIDDYFCLKLVCPAWVTAPTTLYCNGYVVASLGH